MLANLDVLIGLSVIMLGLSLVVTVVGQMASNALAARGTNLKWGLGVLLQELHPERFIPRRGLPFFGLDVNRDAKAVAARVLEHPLVSDSRFPVGAWRLSTVIRFDEFMKTITLLAATSGNPNDNIVWLSANNKVTEPWFNSMMDRLSQRFTMLMRLYTVTISILLVLVVGVDTSYILKTLRSDAALRSGLVGAADTIVKNPDTATEVDKQKVKDFASSVIKQLPSDQSLWSVLRPEKPSRYGELLSMMLLSLGAPFWFNALKNLTALRPLLANKEDQERARSQKATAPDVGDSIRWEEL